MQRFEENIWVAIFAKYGFSILGVYDFRNFALLEEQDAGLSKNALLCITLLMH